MRLIVSSDNATYPHVDYIGCVKRRWESKGLFVIAEIVTRL